DIRTEAEYLAGHLANTRHISGGQLIQTTDCHLVVQNSHVLLVDDDGVRAATTAVWLRRMGWRNVSVCEINPEMPDLRTGHPTDPNFDDLALINIDEAATMLQSGSATVCDIRSSVDYRRGHIAGAAFLTRAQLEQDAAHLPAGGAIILMASDQVYAELISRDLKRLGHTVRLLYGDLSDWTAASYPVASGLDWLISRPSDTYLQAADFEDRTIVNRLSHVYASWAATLADCTAGEPAMRFDIR
ncbi:MAG: rhodanese-like domain-containing protein, partial [Alphaproteobacteria bacterium]